MPREISCKFSSHWVEKGIYSVVHYETTNVLAGLIGSTGPSVGRLLGAGLWVVVIHFRPGWDSPDLHLWNIRGVLPVN